MRRDGNRLPAGAPLLKVENLVITGRQGDVDKEIVSNATFRLAAGEVLGLIGESGAGKSTLGLASAGYTKNGCRIASGTVHYRDRALDMLPARQLQALYGDRISYVAQSAQASFNPAHRLLEQVIEPALAHGVCRRAEAITRAGQLFRDLGLPDIGLLGRRYPHEVSGGQLQRVMIAMALICDPDIVIFDEPTTALDMTTQIDVIAAIRQVIRGSGMAALYISHDLALVTQLADRVLVMRNGRIVEEGAVADVILAPTHAYTRMLVAARVHKKIRSDATGTVETGLAVRNVAVSYGNHRVVEDVSFNLPKGRTMAIIGESGSGKSSLARAIAGIVAPAHGKIRFGATDLAPRFQRRTPEQLRSIQMIFQSPDVSLNPKHSVGDVIGRPLEFYKGQKGAERDGNVRRLLEMIELDPSMIDRKVNDLSGGQKQRVCIARALAAEPELIICDEITSALDPLVAEGMIALLTDLQKRLALSYLFITHDFSSVEGLADEVIVMKGGTVVETGATEDVFNSSRDPYTRTLLSAVPRMELDWLDRVLKTRQLAQAG